MVKALIVIDMQNDFITGSLGTKEAQAILPNVKRKIKECKENGYDIIFTRDTHFEDYLDSLEGKKLPVEHCIMGTDGWKIYEDLEVPNCTYINKQTFGWELWKDKPWFDSFELCGVCTDICVVSNALALRMFFPETKIIVHSDCCAGTTPENHEAALQVMRSCQIDVI